MRPCPKCHAAIPEGMRFCLQCGASLAPASSPLAPRVSPVAAKFAAAGASPASSDAPGESTRVTAQPQPYPMSLPAVDLRIDAAPAFAPRAGGAVAYYERPSLGDRTIEIDDELFKSSFEKPAAPPGAVVCRFCRAPIDVTGDFCDHCGAPMAEAAPGVVAEPPPDVTAPSGELPAAANVPVNHAGSAAYPPDILAEHAEPAYSLPEILLSPGAPASPLTISAKERPVSFLGRLKRLLKKD